MDAAGNLIGIVSEGDLLLRTSSGTAGFSTSSPSATRCPRNCVPRHTPKLGLEIMVRNNVVQLLYSDDPPIEERQAMRVAAEYPGRCAR